MTADTYKRALEQAVQEHRELIKNREDTERRIARLRETILTLLRLLTEQGEAVSLEDFFDPDEITESGAGLTDAICDVLRGAPETWMNASQVKDKLTGIGFNVAQYTEPLPTIATTLSRLAKSGEIVRDMLDGKAVYKWNVSAFKHSPLKYINQRIKKTGENTKPAWWNYLVDQGGLPVEQSQKRGLKHVHPQGRDSKTGTRNAKDIADAQRVRKPIVSATTAQEKIKRAAEEALKREREKKN